MTGREKSKIPSSFNIPFEEKRKIYLLCGVIGSFYSPFCYNDSELNAMTFKSEKDKR